MLFFEKKAVKIAATLGFCPQTPVVSSDGWGFFLDLLVVTPLYCYMFL